MTPSEWKEKLSRVRDSFLSSLAVADAAGLDEAEQAGFGRKGELSLLLRELKDFPLDERRVLGSLGNEIKAEMASALAEKRASAAPVAKRSSAVPADITLPGRPFPEGSLHPLTIITDRLSESFVKLGFSMSEGPHIEEDYYNFEALNFPPDHPAREMQDTFYLGADGGRLLRTHTTNVEVHVLKGGRPPLRVFHPGRVFRSEAVDASHSFAFHQIEGFYVDRRVSMADLRWTVDAFIKDLFGPRLAIDCIKCKESELIPFESPS